MFKGIIREFKKEDIESIEEIYALYWPDQEFRERLISRLDSQEIVYFVAEERGGVVGIAGFRKVPEHMREFTTGSNPCELYILAAKNTGSGTGKALVDKVITAAKTMKYDELVLYSGETHQESWGFYDHMGFERVADATAPNGELGKIWRMRF